MFKKSMILYLYFWGSYSISSSGQTSKGCTLIEPCHYKRLVAAIQKNLFLRQDTTDSCSTSLDLLCLRLMVQDLEDTSQTQNHKKLLLLLMASRYPQSFNTLPDTLVIPIMLNELRHDTRVVGLGSISNWHKLSEAEFHAGNIGLFIIRKGKYA